MSINSAPTINKRLSTLSTCLTLLHRELTLNTGDVNVGISTDLIKSVLWLNSDINAPKIGNKYLVYDTLQDFISTVLEEPSNYTGDDILDNLNILLKDDPALLSSILVNIKKPLSEEGLKKSTITLIGQLNKFKTISNIKKKIIKASYDISNNKISNIIEYAKTLGTELDVLTSKRGRDIPGIVTEIDIEDDSVEEVFQSVKDLYSNEGGLKTGFVELNTMLQGGFKRGNAVIINALQHEYKSSLTQTLFMQIPMFNKPKMIDVNKKPLVLYISFEDDADVFGSFMYKYLYSSEHGTLPDMKGVSPKGIQSYMQEKLKVNGYHIKMVRVNPAEWTYKDLFNYIIYLESQGYEIHACMVDYLIKMSTAGCVGRGGTEYRDLWDKCRQFFSVRKILFISPHQLSTEAKQLVREGTSKLKLVKEVVGKGYTELSKQIDQVVDVEIAIAKALLNKKWVLTMMIGKHRGAPGILSEEDKYQVLKFPDGMPIPHNLNNEEYKPLTSAKSRDEDDLFAM